MGGIFGFFDYNKPGPGVPKDAPPKARIIVFFEVLKRKFWNLIKLNLLFSVFNIPALIVAFMATGFFRTTFDAKDPVGEFVSSLFSACLLMALPLITVGPAQAGLNYVLRNYSNEDHSFIWWDFKDSAVSNFKQSSIICLIDIVATIFFGTVIKLYNYLSLTYHFMIVFIPIVTVAFIVFILMHLYIYPMLVTFELTVRQIYKNAFLFSVTKLIPNALILVLCYGITLLTFLPNVVLGFALFPIITVSFIGLVVHFYVNPILKKYMIEDSEEQEGTGDKN